MKQSNRETSLLARFLAARFAQARVMVQVRLGPIPLIPGVSDIPGLPWAALANFRRWADAVAIETDRVTLIEAKTIMDPGLPSTLELYGALWRRTPEYAAYSALPLTLMAVVAFDDPVLSQIARAHGVQVVVFTPPDIAGDLLNKYMFRKSMAQSKATPAAVLDDLT